MYKKELEVLKDTVTDKEREALNKYFINLTPETKDVITCYRVSMALDIDINRTEEIICACVEKGILERKYAICCPVCNEHIKWVKKPETVSGIVNCYMCGNSGHVTEVDVSTMYAFSI